MPFSLPNRLAGPTRRTVVRGSRWARPAAFVALLALLGSVAIFAFSVAPEIGNLLIVLVCVFVVAFAGWFAFTRRGLVRVLGVIALLLGLVGLVSFFFSQGLTLLVLIGGLVLFTFTGRYAVRHDYPTVRAARRRWRRVRPARSGVLIINPNSGGGKAIRSNLAEESRKRGVEPLLLEPGTDLRELATAAVMKGADVIGMAGGDGSQATVASVAMQHGVPHVCVPAGTRNHFALDLGLDRDDVVGALDAFTDGVERRIDLASVNECIFVNNASIGVYAQVVQEDAYRDAKLGTWRRRLPEMLGPEATSIDLQFQGPDAREWADAALVVVSNNPYELKRLGGAGTRPRLDTGRLGILATRVRGGRDFAKLVVLGPHGQSRRARGLFHWSCPEFEIRSGAAVPVGLDGEALLLAPPLRFASLPCALRVRVPRHAGRVSPAEAAVAVTHGDVAGLLRIAVGKPRVSRMPGASRARSAEHSRVM
jgi:diacylglycerol kinase family enzyme